MVDRNARGWLAIGKLTFIPKKLATMVGRLSTIVIEARSFMTLFRLLEMIEAKASIMLLRMLLVMLVISIACWFSVNTSSSRSSSYG
jgi:hypothetical protein